VTPVRRLATVIALALLPALAGCGGDDEPSEPASPEASYAQYHSAPAIMADGFETMLALESVHMRAEINGEPGTTLLDLSLRRDGDCLGRLQIPGWPEPADFVVADGRDYVRGTRSFWASSDGGEAAADRYADRWVTTGELASYCAFGNRMAPFTRTIDEQLTSKDGVADVGGTATVKVSTPVPTGRLRAWVEVAEPHHVVRLTLTGGRDTGELDLSAYGEDVEVEAPPADEVVEFTG
jgi:hypothetical protein